jgi:hypothetical protein
MWRVVTEGTFHDVRAKISLHMLHDLSGTWVLLFWWLFSWLRAEAWIG